MVGIPLRKGSMSGHGVWYSAPGKLARHVQAALAPRIGASSSQQQTGERVPSITHFRFRVAIVGVDIDSCKYRGVPKWRGIARMHYRLGLAPDSSCQSDFAHKIPNSTISLCLTSMESPKRGRLYPKGFWLIVFMVIGWVRRQFRFLLTVVHTYGEAADLDDAGTQF